MKIKKNLIVLILFLAMCFIGVKAQDTPENITTEHTRGQVLEILSETSNSNLESAIGGEQTTQLAKVKILDGEYKNKEVVVENDLSANPAFDIVIKKGDRVLVDVEKSPNSKTAFYITDLERAPVLLLTAGLFFMLLLAIGGISGLKSLISLIVTGAMVLLVMVPMILKGFPVILSAVIISIISTFITMFVVAGFNKKSFSASIGTICGVGLAGLISVFVIKFASLTGFTEQESIILWTSRPDLDFKGILTAGMIIGALGATMDVGISIASSIFEVKKTGGILSQKELFQSGLNVGRDIMGTMSNTLILAYVGGALPLILIAVDAPFYKLINLNSISTEITSALAGSLGVILCVPITAWISSCLMSEKNN